MSNTNTVDIKVLSKSGDFTGFITGVLTFNELDAGSVPDMVNQVITKANKTKIRRLDIFAHGTDTYFQIGDDVIHSFTPKLHMPVLGKLAGCFDKAGFLVLDVCEIGKCPSLLTEIARATGVPVYAFAGAFRPVLSKVTNVGNGPTVAAFPDGRFLQSEVEIPSSN
jgi:hypothetical protein